MDLFHFDFQAMTFYVGDSKAELSKTEQKLLRLLVEHRGRTMTRGDPVSYTHLDVYKRQVLFCLSFFT